jgi:hypothetical protein
VLTNGIDANGRLIGFVYPGQPDRPDGAEIFLDEPLVDQSANAMQLTGGHACRAFEATLPVALRNHLAHLSLAAAPRLPAGGWPSRRLPTHRPGDHHDHRGVGGWLAGASMHRPSLTRTSYADESAALAPQVRSSRQIGRSVRPPSGGHGV